MEFNNTLTNWTGVVVNSTTENGKQMVGLWEARFVNYRIILYKLNAYFLPALICIGKHNVILFKQSSLFFDKRDVKAVLSLNERKLQTKENGCSLINQICLSGRVFYFPTALILNVRNRRTWDLSFSRTEEVSLYKEKVKLSRR